MIRKLVAAFVMILFATSIHATAFAADENDYYESEGTYYLENYNPKDPVYRNLARQLARMDALCYLIEKIESVSGTAKFENKFERDDDGTVHDIIKSSVLHDSKVAKYVSKNARQVGNAQFYFDSEGMLVCKVIMRVAKPKDLNAFRE